tara:strand:+ start:9798 stop:10559 length:762 start_codon:yes stop_codon:yes gene_type:complete
MKKKLQIYKMIDKSESYYTKKETIADIPFKMVVCGKSQLSGKTNFCCNMLLLPDFYKNDFEGKNIFIVSGSINSDCKLSTLLSEKEVPAQNTFDFYDEELIKSIYDMIESEYIKHVEEKKRPPNYLIYFDDMSFSGIFKSKNFGIVNKIFSNGRHINLSVIMTAQKCTDLPSNCFENLTLGIFFSCSDRQLDKIEHDVNYHTNKKLFKQKFRSITSVPHSFLAVNFSNPPEEMYLDKNFEPIDFLEKSSEQKD